jgi:HAD-superfamily hydrolase, subfamily IIB
LKYKIIAVDMDGTLLNDDKHISDYNQEMISKAVAAGVKFVIASGRIPSGLKFYEATVSKNQPIISCNGAIILDENKNVIYSNSIEKKDALQVIDVLREQKDTYYHFYSEGIIYSEQFKCSIEGVYNFNRRADRDLRMEIRLIGDAKECIKNTEKDIDKIVVQDKDLKYLVDLRKRLDSIPGVETTKSDIDNIEICAETSNKGNGLKILATHYGISLEECIAIGNDENDISMIKCAGLGVAVRNARDYIKECANYVTERDNNNGAIGEVIERFILNGED